MKTELKEILELITSAEVFFAVDCESWKDYFKKVNKILDEEYGNFEELNGEELIVNNFIGQWVVSKFAEDRRKGELKEKRSKT